MPAATVLDSAIVLVNGGNDFKTATATASFTITEVNDSPNAVTDVVLFYIGPGTRTISQASLLANDTPGPSNECSQTLTFGTVGSPLPSGATVTVSGSDVLYTPPVGYSGPASFTYTVTDNGTTNGAADPLTSTGRASLFFLFPGAALPAVDLNGPAANFSNTVTYTEDNPPVVIPTASSLNYVENSGVVTIAPSVVPLEFDSVAFVGGSYQIALSGATISVSPWFAAEDRLVYNSTAGIGATIDQTTGVLRMNSITTVANYQAALRAIQYQNISDNPTPGARVITFSVTDGTATGSASRTINVLAVNDAPTAD